MRIGDLCTIDADGYLRVVGRTSDIIIRGGKNISAPAVEAEVAEHPAVAVAAAVAMPDEVFGERVCLYAELEPGATLALDDLVDFLRDEGGVTRVVPRAAGRARRVAPRVGRQGGQGRAARRHPPTTRRRSLRGLRRRPTSSPLVTGQPDPVHGFRLRRPVANNGIEDIRTGGTFMDIGSFIAALALGFVCGAIARALVPNDAFRAMSGWRSWVASTVLGLLGALVGYFIFTELLGIGDEDKFDWGGVIGALIGSIIVVALASWLIKRYAGRRLV